MWDPFNSTRPFGSRSAFPHDNPNLSTKNLTYYFVDNILLTIFGNDVLLKYVSTITSLINQKICRC